MLTSYSSEKTGYTDRETGAAVTRLTGWRAGSNHLYFTNNSFFDGGRRIVFESDRGNAQNLYSLDLDSGEIDQLTDLPRLPYGEWYGLLEAFVSYTGAHACYFAGDTLFHLDIAARTSEPLYRMPEGFFHHITSISADGKYVYTSIYEDTSNRLGGDSLQAIADAKPLSRILKIAMDGSSAETVWEEHSFIAHVNASPTDTELLTFCHEGLWDRVDHRLWLLDLRTGTPVKLHPCQPGEIIGHEYWYADGKRIGYHGRAGDRWQLGCVSADGSADRTWLFPFHTGHIFSQDETLIVGDGDREGRFIRVWQLGENGYENPRALCRHDSSFNRQRTHVHPRITPDGKSVLYTSDATGYEQIYLVRLPEDVNDLPPLETLSKY